MSEEEHSAVVARIVGRDGVAKWGLSNKGRTGYPTGTGSQYKLHRVIRKFITTVPEGRRAGSHGNCAELDAISRLLFEYEATYNRRFRTIEEAREFLKGARIQIRDIHLGERKPPCTTCRPTLEALGIEHKDPP